MKKRRPGRRQAAEAEAGELVDEDVVIAELEWRELPFSGKLNELSIRDNGTALLEGVRADATAFAIRLERARATIRANIGVCCTTSAVDDLSFTVRYAPEPG